MRGPLARTSRARPSYAVAAPSVTRCELGGYGGADDEAALRRPDTAAADRGPRGGRKGEADEGGYEVHEGEYAYYCTEEGRADLGEQMRNKVVVVAFQERTGVRPVRLLGDCTLMDVYLTFASAGAAAIILEMMQRTRCSCMQCMRFVRARSACAQYVRAVRVRSIPACNAPARCTCVPRGCVRIDLHACI